MEKKIGLQVLLLWIFQSLLIAICHKHFNINNEISSSYLIQTALWHLMMLFFLLLYKSEFSTVTDNKPLEKINLANKISLFRISSVSLIAFLLQNYNIEGIKYILAIAMISIFVTDFLDGFIARHFNQVTKIGKMLDSMGDYALLLLVSIVYYNLKILPHWFLYLILTRLILQGVGVTIFMILKFPLKTGGTIGGKITIALTMLLYAAKLSQLFFKLSSQAMQNFCIAEYICGSIIFILSFEKMNIFYNHYKKYKKAQL